MPESGNGRRSRWRCAITAPRSTVRQLWLICCKLAAPRAGCVIAILPLPCRMSRRRRQTGNRAGAGGVRRPPLQWGWRVASFSGLTRNPWQPLPSRSSWKRRTTTPSPLPSPQPPLPAAAELFNFPLGEVPASVAGTMHPRGAENWNWDRCRTTCRRWSNASVGECRLAAALATGGGADRPPSVATPAGPAGI